jgi:hypothetical protein
MTFGPHRPRLSFRVFIQRVWEMGWLSRIMMLSPVSALTAAGMIMYGAGDMPAAK